VVDKFEWASTQGVCLCSIILVRYVTIVRAGVTERKCLYSSIV